MTAVKWKNWIGTLCCFVVFILIFIGYRFGLSYRDPLQGHINPGLLLFLLPGAIGGMFSCNNPVGKPLLGALLAGLPCLAMIMLWCPLEHSFWQDLALVLSAIFWSALGALCLMVFIRSIKNVIPQRFNDK